MEIVGTQVLEMKQETTRLLADAEAIYANAEASAEDRENAGEMFDNAMGIKERLDKLVAIKAASEGVAGIAEHEQKDDKDGKGPLGSGQFKSMGEFYRAVYASTFKGIHDPRLVLHDDPTEPGHSTASTDGWIESTKDLVESIGASGGFLVPTEDRTELLQWTPDVSEIRQRATIIPMRRRSVRIPTLDQTGTTAGQPHWWGGILAKWTEEVAEKDETEPTFRQITLTAHKLVCYTEAGDELLADAAISLEAFLGAAFKEVINWYSEHAFVNGTGAGQPTGIVGAGATLTVPRAAAGAIDINDVVGMLESFQGRSPIWLASRQALSNLMLLNGPALNPSYVFMPSARDAMPHNLFGYPLYFSEMCPALGTAGDLILADWSKYLIGERQAITVDSSKHYKFQNDITSWRAVARLDGQPWLSAPLTYQDGVTQVSPFVVLGDAAGT